ncbi:MAG: hypothetical protein V8T46_11195 [Sutterella seckii]
MIQSAGAARQSGVIIPADRTTEHSSVVGQERYLSSCLFSHSLRRAAYISGSPSGIRSRVFRSTTSVGFSPERISDEDSCLIVTALRLLNGRRNDCFGVGLPAFVRELKGDLNELLESLSSASRLT